jgi:hypothetical protein
VPADIPECGSPLLNCAPCSTRAPHRAALIDVRDPQEFASGHIAQAINIPLADLAQRLTGQHAALPVFICLSGVRSLRAAPSPCRRSKRPATAGARAWSGRRPPKLCPRHFSSRICHRRSETSVRRGSDYASLSAAARRPVAVTGRLWRQPSAQDQRSPTVGVLVMQPQRAELTTEPGRTVAFRIAQAPRSPASSETAVR